MLALGSHHHLVSVLQRIFFKEICKVKSLSHAADQLESSAVQTVHPNPGHQRPLPKDMMDWTRVDRVGKVPYFDTCLSTQVFAASPLGMSLLFLLCLWTLYSLLRSRVRIRTHRDHASPHVRTGKTKKRSFCQPKLFREGIQTTN